MTQQPMIGPRGAIQCETFAGLGPILMLSNVLLNPLDYVADETCRIGDVTCGALRSAASNPSFRGPLNRALSEALGWRELAFDDSFVDRVRVDQDCHLATMIIIGAVEDLATARMTVAAAILHRSLLGCLRKAERERLRTALGDDIFDFGVREAPILYAALADILGRAHTPLFEEQQTSGDVARQFMSIGSSVLNSYAAEVDPILGELARLRRDPPSDGIVMNVTFDPKHVPLVTRLLTRRIAKWRMSTA